VNILKKFLAEISNHREVRRLASETFVSAVVSSETPSGGVHECLSVPLTTKASCILNALDQGLVGTPEYLGIAYFWASEYKHELRAATPKQRKAVHDAILAAGLRLDDVTQTHAAIVRKFTAKRVKKVYG
jgi:hypothetical protein